MTTPAPTPAPTATPNGAAPSAPEGTGTPGQAPQEALDAGSKKAFALLAKRERGLALKAQDLAQKSQALKDREAEYQTWQQERAAFKRDPSRFLTKELGEKWYDKLTEVQLNGGKVTPELVDAAVDERIQAFERKQEAERKQAQQDEASRVAKEHEEFFSSWRQDVAAFVKAQGDAYELINAFEVHDRVTAKIESEFAKTKKLLTPKEAADLVEQELEGRGSKSRKLGKATAAPAPAGAPRPSSETNPPQRRALSNDMAASSQASRPPPKDDAERRARALAAMDEVERRRRQA